MFYLMAAHQLVPVQPLYVAPIRTCIRFGIIILIAISRSSHQKSHPNAQSDEIKKIIYIFSNAKHFCHLTRSHVHLNRFFWKKFNWCLLFLIALCRNSALFLFSFFKFTSISTPKIQFLSLTHDVRASLSRFHQFQLNRRRKVGRWNYSYAAFAVLFLLPY